MALLSEHNLEKLKTNYNLSTFFETGTGLFEGLNHALGFGWDHVFSCDLIYDTVMSARTEFKGRAKILRGKSWDCVRCFLRMREADPESYGNVLWWLDAHFPGVDTGDLTFEQSGNSYPADGLPLCEELQAIADYVCDKDVILVDDAFLYRANVSEVNPFGRVPPDLHERALGSVESVLFRFRDTHDLTVQRTETGSFILKPKCITNS